LTWHDPRTCDSSGEQINIIIKILICLTGFAYQENITWSLAPRYLNNGTICSTQNERSWSLRKSSWKHIPQKSVKQRLNILYNSKFSSFASRASFSAFHNQKQSSPCCSHCPLHQEF
jgi:hypothetical protein